MALLETDIKLLKSERMTDNSDGGGRMTGAEVVDGVSNNMFPDVSSLDRVNGDLSLRKVFLAVVKENIDTYYGAHVAINQLPADPDTDVVVFDTSTWSDERSDAIAGLEAYMTKASKTSYTVYDAIEPGDDSIVIYSDSLTPSPFAAGDTVCFSWHGDDEYLKVTDVQDVIHTTYQTSSGFVISRTMRVVTLSLSAGVVNSYTWAVGWSGDAPAIYTTSAGSAHFYGAAPLSVGASTNDSTVTVSRTDARLLPSARQDSYLAAVAYSSPRAHYVARGSLETVNINYSVTSTDSVMSMYDPRGGLMPGTVEAAIYTDVNRTQVIWRVKDDGKGGMSLLYNNGRKNVSLGTIDYDTGYIYIEYTEAWGYTRTEYMTISATPALRLDDGYYSDHIAITTVNRKLSHSKTLSTIPAKSSVAIQYRSGGVWKLLIDAGTGTLSGDGLGSINFSTGTVAITLSSLPDEDTSIIYSWASDNQLTQRSVEATSAPVIKDTLTHTGIDVDSVVITLPYGGSTATITDDASGNLSGAAISDGAVNYTTGEWWIQPVSMPDAGDTSVDYTVAATPYVDTLVGTPLTVDLRPSSADPLLPGATRFRAAAYEYVEIAGAIYHSVDHLSNVGVPAGTVDHATGIATISAYNSGTPINFSPRSVITTAGDWSLSSAILRISADAIKPGSVTVYATRASDSAQLSVTDDGSGAFTGADITGTVDYASGVMIIAFTAPVDPATITYDATTYYYRSPNESLTGINATRLPNDGRVPIFRTNDVLVIQHAATETLPNPLSAGQAVALSRGTLASCKIYDQADTLVATDKYTIDLDAGTVTMSTPLDLSAYTQPLKAVHRNEDMVLCLAVATNGKLTFMPSITHDYPADETVVSSALLMGDKVARVSNVFDQETWTQVWSDGVIGNGVAGAQYDKINHPIAVDNASCETERWAIVFTGGTSFKVVGETLGEVATGSTAVDLAPINPRTGNPYFTLLAIGWGGGWGAGNVLRFNTIGANHPIWVARIIQPGAAQGADSFGLQLRGDIDA